ncbi:hypothetical protein [Actinokineospora globicatena]|uniref:hypothetical protein n=1 Tax=Actinokineospora globicatena TaxID=103729 RepID=UPI0020A25629|nr:hypothetical protein [Actinokineospora globicatena]MCP2300542.1 hypothetical protein [Actinokineospora globicatena]GLW81085.1 hypothetical protein Aglo01_55660 [Actinokineospora globicatena]GLW88278.1 hypothetical protein Aglo02_59170 [Actinokineospora globicatena]
MRKILTTLALTAIGVLSLSSHAGADPVEGTVTAADSAKAQAAASAPDVTATVGKFLGTTGFAAPQVGGSSVAVYELSPDFVSGRSPKVGRLAYVAVPATAGGATASVWTVRSPSGAWTVANIAAGDLEFRNAGKIPAGALLLREPQTNTWYAVTGNAIRSLTTGKSQTLAQYQRDVATRYADKLPGSAYDRSGMAGGFASPSTGTVSPTGTGTPGSATAPWAVLGILVLGVAAVVLTTTAPALRRR